jgi:hypothetical protein
VFHSSADSFVTEIKSEDKKTLLTPSISKSRVAKGEITDDSALEKSTEPVFKTVSPGINFNVSGFGVSSV